MNDDTNPNPDAAIQAELDAIADASAPSPAAAAAPPPITEPMDWRMASTGVVLVVDRLIAPNWNLDAAEKDALSEGITQVLSAFFPKTNLDPRVQSVLALGAVVLAISAKRTDFATGKVAPLRIVKPPAPAANDDRFPLSAAD